MKLVTINLAGLQYGWFGGRRTVLLEQLNRLSPDVVFLQETTILPEEKYDQTTDLKQSLGLSYSAFAPYGNHREFESPRLGGIGILSRYPFYDVRSRKLPESKVETYGARCALFAETVIEDTPLLLATTHFSWRLEEEDLRVEQARELLECFEERRIPVILGGDFNSSAGEAPMEVIRSRYMDVSPGDRSVTWDLGNTHVLRSERSSEQIDYIFASGELAWRGAKVVLDEACPIHPSDHFGLFAEFIFR